LLAPVLSFELQLSINYVDIAFSQTTKNIMPVSDVTVKNNAIHFGENTSISFQRTLRIPDDDKVYPLPPSLGNFPIYRVQDYERTVPQHWLKSRGVFIPIYQREALWVSFNCPYREPKALKLAIGKVNAISGKEWSQELVAKRNSSDNQDYVVIPNQPWLDGINAGDGFIKQFVAMPLGKGYTVEAQVTGKEEVGGVQLIVYDAKPGAIKVQEMEEFCIDEDCEDECDEEDDEEDDDGDMGLGAGGRMKQSIYEDPYGIDCWDQNNFGRIFIHLVNSEKFEKITGQKPPATPISASTYTSYGYPWFVLYDEHVPAVEKSGILSQVKSIKEIDQEKFAFPQQNDNTVNISASQVYNAKSNNALDGDW
jgi:hypothetical protein